MLWSPRIDIHSKHLSWFLPGASSKLNRYYQVVFHHASLVCSIHNPFQQFLIQRGRENGKCIKWLILRGFFSGFMPHTSTLWWFLIFKYKLPTNYIELYNQNKCSDSNWSIHYSDLPPGILLFYWKIDSLIYVFCIFQMYSTVHLEDVYSIIKK